ncbi:hypothetical protein Ddye_015341 [Dipteronia dyeriana]|uniref:Reverse transcriptase domain-containing protein n=1 Tax=Dipteronia dyeriana TaxID=168575 RepID=A0AAD9WZ84_9ROSI|nr:hypothetical protein Ddye_015341 [Dipteronia dyeriana]
MGSVLSSSAGHIDIRFSMEDGFGWRFTGFYGESNPSKIAASWSLLRRLRDVDTLPWVCVGDFNELLSMSDKVGGSDKSFSSMNQFRQAVDDCNLIDLGYSGPRLTWNNKRDGKWNIQERLDRYLPTNQWRDKFWNASVFHLGFNSSDHRPILLNCTPVFPFSFGKDRSFKFEPFCLKEADYHSTVVEAWNKYKGSNHLANLASKLRGCASSLRGWSKYRFGNIRRQIEGKNREIERLYSLSGRPCIMSSIRVLEKSVEGLIDCDELYWRQRSRLDWLQSGDRNSRLVHARATARRKKNFISSLIDRNGRVQDSYKGLASTVRDFYYALFLSSRSSTQDILEASKAIRGRLSTNMSDMLSLSFTAEDVKATIFDLNPTKAPGPDGFHAIFFQKAWGVVGDDVTRTCLGILNGSSPVREFNDTNVVLILKVKNLVELKDFRSISLCSVVYKIITKAMATRLKSILPEIISPYQSAFVPGRQIFDNVLVAFEIQHSINRKKSVKRGQMALKLDMSKAYDRVEWEFLFAVMEKMNFPSNWINLTMDCITTSSLSFLLNGQSVCSVDGDSLPWP